MTHQVGELLSSIKYAELPFLFQSFDRQHLPVRRNDEQPD